PRLEQFLALGKALAGWQEKLRVAIVGMPAVSVGRDPSAGFQEVSVRVDNFAGSGPTAQQSLMCYAHENTPGDIFIGDEQPCSDQGVNESQSRRCTRHFAEQNRTRCNDFVAWTNRGEGSQGCRQRVLNVRREGIDDFVGAPRDGAFEAAEGTICS